MKFVTRIGIAACLAVSLSIPFAAAREAPAGGPLPVSVSPNGHYLVTSDGKPFFWLADTAWELIHSTTREEAQYYLQARAQEGFTVIQTVVLGPNFIAFGKRPDFTPAHQFDLLMGTMAAIGGFADGSPMICFRRRKVVF